MIARLRGTLVERGVATAVVEVGGVGYLVHLAPAAHLPGVGQEVVLHTSLQVREDSMTLYGFLSAEELATFELLLTSSGVGPKLALAALGTHRPEVLLAAIAGGDEATLTAIPGVGRKVAQRLVLELKDRIGALPVAASTGAAGAAAPVGGVAEEVRAALLGLGYSTGEVAGALGAVDGTDDRDAGALLRAALKVLGGGHG